MKIFTFRNRKLNFESITFESNQKNICEYSFENIFLFKTTKKHAIPSFVF